MIKNLVAVDIDALFEGDTIIMEVYIGETSHEPAAYKKRKFSNMINDAIEANVIPGGSMRLNDKHGLIQSFDDMIDQLQTAKDLVEAMDEWESPGVSNGEPF